MEKKCKRCFEDIDSKYTLCYTCKQILNQFLSVGHQENELDVESIDVD